MTFINKQLFFYYFGFLLLFAPFHLLSFDSYYYWDWSRHLAMGYYDGSPMIAYLIHASTLVFGHTLFALNMVSIASTAFCTFLLYKTARSVLSSKASYICIGLWLFSPLVTLDLLRQSTYDNPLTIFWILSLYCVARYMQTTRWIYLYSLGCSIGCLLLSKYSGIVLLLAFALFMMGTHYRALFRSRHFYITLLLSILFFSPVLIWNAQHHWQSIIYQLTTHEVHDHQFFLIHCIQSLFSTFIPSLNLMLLPPLFYYLRPSKGNTPDFIKLCFFICMIFLMFYLIVSCFAQVRSNWLSPFLITSALLGGYYFDIQKKHTYYPLLIQCYAVISFIILLNSATFFGFIPSKKRLNYQLIQQLNTSNIAVPKLVFGIGWLDARALFFLRSKPLIETIDCGYPENQYQLWKTPKPEEVLIITQIDANECLKKHFEHCVASMILNAKDHKIQQVLYVYHCIHPRTTTS